jgi:hypothetical protein
LKGGAHRSNEVIAEFLMLGEREDIEEIAHATIRLAENYHGVKFLGDGRLRSVRSKSWSGQVEQRRILEPVGFRDDRIPNANVNLHRQSGIAEAPFNRHPQSAVHILGPDGRDTDRGSPYIRAKSAGTLFAKTRDKMPGTSVTC